MEMKSYFDIQGGLMKKFKLKSNFSHPISAFTKAQRGHNTIQSIIKPVLVAQNQLQQLSNFRTNINNIAMYSNHNVNALRENLVPSMKIVSQYSSVLKQLNLDDLNHSVLNQYKSIYNSATEQLKHIAAISHEINDLIIPLNDDEVRIFKDIETIIPVEIVDDCEKETITNSITVKYLKWFANNIFSILSILISLQASFSTNQFNEELKQLKLESISSVENIEKSIEYLAEFSEPVYQLLIEIEEYQQNLKKLKNQEIQEQENSQKPTETYMNTKY